MKDVYLVMVHYDTTKVLHWILVDPGEQCKVKGGRVLAGPLRTELELLQALAEAQRK